VFLCLPGDFCKKPGVPFSVFDLERAFNAMILFPRNTPFSVTEIVFIMKVNRHHPVVTLPVGSHNFKVRHLPTAETESNCFAMLLAVLCSQ